MWHKAIWKGHPMRLELTRVGLLAELANHYTTRGASHESWYAKKPKPDIYVFIISIRRYVNIKI